MPKKSITITLSEETQINLEMICKKYGLKKSQAIAFVINSITEQIDNEKGERNEK